MKKSTLLFVLCSLSLFLTAQSYHQNGSFESHTPVPIGHPLFINGDIDHWTGSANNSELHESVWCPVIGGSQTINASDGDYFGRIYSGTFIRNNLNDMIFPGQLVTVSVDHRTSICTEAFMEGAFYLHNSASSNFSLPGNFYMGNFISGPNSWGNTSLTVDVPVFETSPCFFDQGDIRAFGPYNIIEGGGGNDLRQDPELIYLDDYKLTGCTTPTDDLLFYNIGDELCTRVSFTLDCNLDEKVWYYWEFGDGSTLCGPDEPNPTHNYAEPGSYDVKLTTVNENGCIEIIETTINIYCEGCDETIADFSTECVNCKPFYTFGWDPVSGKWIKTLVGYSCQIAFTDNSTSGSPIVSWSWTYPNGSSNLQNPTFSFSAPVLGTSFYEVCLTVVDAAGCVSNVCDEISVPCRFRVFNAEQSNETLSIQRVNTYPNPAGDEVTLEIEGDNYLGNLETTIYNLNGQVMKSISKTIDDSYAKINIETIDFPNGTYLIKLQSNNEVINRKIIVQH